MQISVSLQLAQIAASVLLGFALGGLYDILRVIRRASGKNALADVLFGVAAIVSVFSLGMDIGGGALHIFMLCSVLLGTAMYMLLLSRIILKALDAVARAFGFIVRPVKKALEFFSKTVKKLFAKFTNCSTILMRKLKRRVFGKNEKIDDDSRSGIDDAGRICYSEPCKHQRRPAGCDGADRNAEGRDRKGSGNGAGAQRQKAGGERFIRS